MLLNDKKKERNDSSFSTRRKIWLNTINTNAWIKMKEQHGT